MTGYVAVERLERPRIRFGPGERNPWGLPREAPAAEIEEIAGEPFEERLRERWDDIVVAWRQTTFFLFDPEGWR